ncbi:MAG: hypothetical protein V9G12_00015 [Microthrixaceae bacterium]
MSCGADKVELTPVTGGVKGAEAKTRRTPLAPGTSRWLVMIGTW